jgi:hypothetical protein
VQRPQNKEVTLVFEQTTVETQHGPITAYATPFGMIALVDPKWLDVDNGADGYQRPYDSKWAEKIAAQWDDTKARPVNARLRDGFLFLTNGQHTANAAVMAGRNQILAIINNGSPSRQREAQEFSDFQTKVKRMTPYDSYRAALVAMEHDALVVRKVTNERGIMIGPKKDKDCPGRVLTSVTVARKIAQESGEETLREVFDVCTIWDENDPARFRYEVLAGVHTAILGNGKARVVENAERTPIAKLWAEASRQAGGKGGYVAISNLASALGKRRRPGPVPSVVRET